jgi:hypothetical protein
MPSIIYSARITYGFLFLTVVGAETKTELKKKLKEKIKELHKANHVIDSIEISKIIVKSEYYTMSSIKSFLN